MTLTAKQICGGFGWFVLAMIVTFVMGMFCMSVIDGLPRTMEGEAVRGPKMACMAFVIFGCVILPWSVAVTVLENARTKIYFLLCLSMALVIWCMPLGMLFLIEKAYRRGL